MPLDETEKLYAYADPYHLVGQREWVQMFGTYWLFQWALVEVTAMESVTKEYHLGLTSLSENPE